VHTEYCSRYNGEHDSSCTYPCAETVLRVLNVVEYIFHGFIMLLNSVPLQCTVMSHRKTGAKRCFALSTWLSFVILLSTVLAVLSVYLFQDKKYGFAVPQILRCRRMLGSNPEVQLLLTVQNVLLRLQGRVMR
jgi:hypothetical protein